MNINNPNIKTYKKYKNNENKDINENKDTNENNNIQSNAVNQENKNRINYIQLNNVKSKNNKRKNRRKIQERIKEEYDDYIGFLNNNDMTPIQSIENLILVDNSNDVEYKLNKISYLSNQFKKSKSFNNFNKVRVNDMKDSIRKNASHNFIGDIMVEINKNNSIIDLFQKNKKNNSFSSLTNVSYNKNNPNNKISKCDTNNSNKFIYLMGEDCVDLEKDISLELEKDIGLELEKDVCLELEKDIGLESNNNEKNKIIYDKKNTINQNQNNYNTKSNNNKNKKPSINFNEITDLDEKINSVADYHLIHTPFKMIGESILNEEINGKYKSKIKSNPENEYVIRKLKDTFKKLVCKELKEKPNISQILLDNDLDDELKVKVLRKYIKFTTEDEVFSDEADKIKIEIKNLLKQKKLRVSDDYEELGKQVELKIIPNQYKTKLEDIYYRVINGDQPKLHNLLNNLLKLPFESKSNILNEMSHDNISREEKIKFIKSLYSKLDTDLYGLEETKDSIISWICQKINNPTQKTGKYLCLCGPAGVGKTSIVHSISKSLNIPYSYISLANIDEPGSLIGHGYTYEGSQCGSIANGLISNNCINGILLFDELDKAKEKVQTTLLGIFDPLQNTKFRDAYFGEFNLNLSECMMIVCLNDISNVNPILRDRLHIVNITGYNTKDKKNIISKHIIPKLNLQYNLNKIEIEDKVIDEIIDKTKNYSGVRQIQMYITKIYELITLDEYTNKYSFNGVFSIKNINLLKLTEQNMNLS